MVYPGQYGVLISKVTKMSLSNTNNYILDTEEEYPVHLVVPGVFLGAVIDGETKVVPENIPDIDSVTRLGLLIKWLFRKNIARAYIVKTKETTMLEVFIGIDNELALLHFEKYSNDEELDDFLSFYKSLLDPLWDSVTYGFKGDWGEDLNYSIRDVNISLKKQIDLDEIHPHLKEYVEYNYDYLKTERVELYP